MGVMLIDGELYDEESGELVNEVEQVEVEVVEHELPAIVCNGGTHIKTNTEQLKKELTLYLEKYDFEITQETEYEQIDTGEVDENDEIIFKDGEILTVGEKDASKQATELNKLAKDLNDKRVSVGKEIKKPAETLKENVDELIKLVKDKREKIIESVDVFKQKRFDIIRKLLEQERDRLFQENKVSPEYQFLDIESLVKETSFGKFKLTKVAKESLESMVRGIKAVEDAVTIRTLQLKVTCIDRGLQFPIELNEVESFIKESDYDERLETMIEARLNVEKAVKEKADKDAEEKAEFLRKENERVEREKEEKIKREEREKIEEENRLIQEEQDKKDKLERVKLEQEKITGKKIVSLVAIFEVEVDAGIDDEKVLAKFRNKLSEFTTLKSVSLK